MTTRYGLKLIPHETTVDALRAVWRIADEAGFDHCWTNDHFASAVSENVAGDVYEGWMLLGAMAEATSRVRIGCMVTGNTYRHPAVLAKMAATVDHLSGGRLEFGLGAGWSEIEHKMLGLEFGTVGERMGRFEEACRLIRSLWTEEKVTFTGRHYTLDDAVSRPQPVQRPHPPIWIGGKGRKRSLRIAATYADVWNAHGASPDEFSELSGVLDEHCASVGRDPGAIRRTIQLTVSSDVRATVAESDEFIAIGAHDVIFAVRDEPAVARAEQLAHLLVG